MVRGDGAKRARAEVEGRELTLSNLDKVLYPAIGFTKRDVIDYYAHVAPVLLPHLQGRPLTVVRYPDGVEGKALGFVQPGRVAGGDGVAPEISLAQYIGCNHAGQAAF